MIIYQIINNVNQKIYIGQTIQNLSYRISHHKTRSKDKKYYNIALYKAINKYGWKNFSFNTIHTCVSKEDMDKMEKYYINKYNSYNRGGYNMTNGGEGTIGYSHTEETKKKQSKLKEGMYFGKDNPYYGKKHSEEIKNKMKKTYEITDPKGNTFIIKGIMQFCKDNSLDPGTFRKVMSGKYKQHKGYTGRRLD